EEKINIRSQYYSDKPLVSFSFDDGRKEDWTRFKPIFDSEGIVGNICLITDQVGNSSSMTIEQVKELKNNGWSVASHLKTHPDLRNISLVQAEKELKGSQEFLKKHGLDYDILVYPFGGYNDETLKLTRKYYPYAIDIDRNFPNLPRDFRNIRIYRTTGLSQPGGTLEKCKQYVDDAIEKGDWVIFEDHSHYEFYDHQENLDLLRELIQYVKYKGVEIVSYREGINRKANII